jgi:multiple sugar transport system permease protein
LFQKMGLNLNLLAPSVVPISVGNMITWGSSHPWLLSCRPP